MTYHSTIQNVSYENKNEVLNTFGLCDDDDLVDFFSSGVALCAEDFFGCFCSSAFGFCKDDLCAFCSSDFGL